MYHHTPLTSSRISDYRTDFDHELSLLPPSATWTPVWQQDHVEDRGLLNSVDTTYYPTQVHDTKKQWPTLGWRIHNPLGRYFRLYDPNDPNSQFQGWRRAVIVAASFTGFVLGVNTVFMIVCLARFPAEAGVGVFYRGDCDLVKRWNTGLHLTINVLGTIVLAASSFTMQCLCSPTRSEVNAAHAKRKSLEIGLVSFSNLFHVKRWKAVLWLLLCWSTMPLHLLWNSTVFSTTSTNLFAFLVVEEGFLNGASYELPEQDLVSECFGYQSTDLTNVIDTIYSGYQQGSYTQLTATECFNEYSGDLLPRQRNLIVVVDQPESSGRMSACGYGSREWQGSSLIGMDVNYEPGVSWMLVPWSSTYKNLTTLRNEIQRTGVWTIGNMTVQSCQSEVVNAASCELRFVSYILFVVVACNVIKLACMCIAARFLWNLNEPILATVGDAVSSFLDHPDQTTKGLCLVDHQDVAKGVWKRVGMNTNAYNPTYQRPKTQRLYFATSHVRWWLTMIPLTLYVCTGFALWNLSLNNLTDYSFTESMKLKFGSVDAGLILNIEGNKGGGLITNIVVANSFQVVLSATYFLYNSLYTAQCAALEWASYVGKSLKPLRVTWPRGQQHETYYLHLPYRYGMPLTGLLLLVHFLISQSIFLAILQYRDWQGDLTGRGFADVGFSPRATLTTCLIGVVMILTQVAHSFRPLDTRIPIHGNNSAVISATCHPQNSGVSEFNQQNDYFDQGRADGIATLPLMWGVTEEPFEHATVHSTKECVGHCTFSETQVNPPDQGKQYR